MNDIPSLSPSPSKNQYPNTEIKKVKMLSGVREGQNEDDNVFPQSQNVSPEVHKNLNGSPDVKPYQSDTRANEGNIKLKLKPTEDERSQRDRIGSATSKYLSQKGGGHKVILENEDEDEESPENQQVKKEMAKERRQ